MTDLLNNVEDPWNIISENIGLSRDKFMSAPISDHEILICGGGVRYGANDISIFDTNKKTVSHVEESNETPFYSRSN